MDAELGLPPVVASVAEARRLVQQTLTGWGLDPSVVQTAELLTSEVVTNSVLHARTHVHVMVQRLGESVTISVRDGSPRMPRARQHPPDATTGRGLHLLDTLAAEWHVEAHGEGKTLSFTVTARGGAY